MAGGGDLSFDSDDVRKNICSVLVFEDDIGSISVRFNISVGMYIVYACCCCHVIHLAAYECGETTKRCR